ncbi:hemagglutinin repeat-containing protein [Fusobacterium nucleatum]|uniref:hemagglutinin repeat-containing protein n=1 Tax=Fusobacterium nucleatum TaxID=851 RepID=UPI0030D4D2E3
MKGSLKRLIAIFMLFLHIVSLSDGIVPDSTASKNLQLDKAANGVPLVNIEAPDNNGISHNVYKEYNVDERGAILNNSKDLTNSQLGGLIYGNPNLQNTNEASTIINEVSGVNRSRIEGYQEIAGKKANYILANPNGIYVNGAGFINTGNVTLTTGSRNNLQNPEKGIIEVAGKGLDLRNINKAELVARVAELSAPIYGGEEVNLKLGSQGQSNKPEYALDARALGSIYAGRINIVVNEDGVGVKTEAPIYATKGDVVISSKGKVYLKDTQAKGDIKISSTETEISEKLISENKINIENKKLLNKGEIVANNDVTIKGDIENNKLIFTNKDLNIEGNLKNIADIQAKNNIEINSKNIENAGLIVADKKTHINSDNINNTNKLVAKDTLDINNKTLTNSGKILSGKETKIVNQSLNNSGDITSSGKSDLKVRNLTNDGNILSVGNISISQNQKLTNNNQIQSSEDILINSKDIVNNKTMFSKNKLEIKSKSLNNKNEIVAIGKVQIDSDILENDKTNGVIFSKGELNLTSNKINLTTNIGAGKLLKIQTNELERDNSYITNSDLDIKVNGNYKNEYELIGKNLKLEANNLENNSIIASSGNTEIKGNNSFKNNENSLLYGRKLLKLEGKDFTNKGEVSSFGNLNMNFTGDITNLNTIEAVGDGEITANNFTNKGYLTGGYSKKWVKGSESNIDINKLPKELIKKVDDELQELLDNTDGENVFWHGNNRHLSDAEEGISHYVAHKAHLKIGENLTFNITNRLLNQEADILAGKNIIINAKELNNTREGKDIDITLKFSRTYSQRGGSWHHHKTEYHDHWVLKPYKQTLYSDKPTQIIAGGNLTINAKEVGNGEYQDHKSGYINDVKKVEKDSNIKNTSIDDTFKITNNSVVEKIKKDSAVGVEDYIEIPKNDNGMFIVNKKAGNPKFSYLIETNPKMIDRGFYLSSEYFFSRIKFNPDKNIRLLGDSFYENRLITRAVLEGTGKRYLYSNNANEERKKLFDNAIAAQKDLNLSLGVALSKEQINNLKSDILWYVEEVVNGEKVLVPKLYLSKNTLKSIAEEQGNIIKAGGNFVVNNASIVDNSGKIIAKNNVLIKSKNIYQNAAYSDTGIYANDIALTAKENIENIGGNIVAANKVSIYSEDGDIKNSKKLSIHENDYHDVYTDVRGSGNIVANNINIVGNNVENTGADIKAQDKIEIGAKKNLVIGNLEAIDKKVRDGGKDYISDEKRTNIGSNLNAKDISLTSLGDIGITGSNIVATNKASIQAKGDISIVAGKDSVLHKEKHSKSKGFGRSSSEESVAYATRNVASNIIGDKVNITSEKDVNIFGSNIQANTEGQIKADGNITQAGVKDINYSYHKTTKKGFMGLTSKSIMDENYAEKAILSATLGGDKGLTYDSKNNLILSGVKVVSSGSIDLKGKNVEINPLETKSYNKHKEVKRGFSGSFSPKGISVSYGKDKLSSDTDILNQTASQIISNKDINIEATDKVKAKSVDIYAKNDVNISGDNGVEISTANNSYDNTTKQSSSRIGANFGVNPAIVNTVENVKNIKELTDFSGNSYDILNNASKVVGAIKDGAKATIAVADTNYKGATDAGYDNLKISKNIFNASVSYNKSESKSSVHNESVEKSSLVSGNNMNIKSKNGSINISGTDVKVGNDLDLSAKKDIVIKASEENYTSSGSSSQTGISLSANLEEGRIADLSVSQAGTRAGGNGTNYINSTVNVGGKLKTNSENLTLSGANVEADKLDIKAKNVVIESKQDKSERKDSSYGGSFSIDLVNPSSFSANINGSKGSGEKDWVNKQSSLIAKNGGKIDTDSLTNIGAVIGSENEKEKLKVSANKVVVKDLEDKNKYENIGGGISFGTDVPNVSIKHDKVDKEQINRASAINTDFEISGKKTSTEDLGFNTDIDKAQEKTKDEEKHLDAELHTDLLGKDKQEELKKAGGIISDLTTALGNKSKTEGDFLERYKQLSMMRAIGDQVAKNPEYLSILDKKAIKNGKIDDKTQVEQVSVMNKLLNDALRAKGYAGPDIKMVLTDVEDPNGPYYTDTLTNVVVFDRKQLANSNRDEILNALGHEFGHYSKEDNKTGNQTIANYSGDKLEARTKGMVSKEATEETLASIRNNPNVITGEEGKKLAESIPMERREYVKWGRVFRGTALTFLGGFRTFLGISEVGLGAASSSVGVGVLVVGHGAAQTGFGISDMGEGIHDIYLGFKDVDDEEQQAVRISKKVLGKYEEPLNFAVGTTTDQAVVIGQAFYRFPRISNMTGNTNSSTKKESSSNVTTEKQKSNNNGAEKVVEDTATVKTVGSNNKNAGKQNNYKEVVSKKSITKDKSGTNQGTVDTTQKAVSKNTNVSTNKTQSEKATLNEGKQGKHVVGHNNFQQGKGEVDMETARNILNDYQGTGRKIERDGNIVKEIVDTQGKYTGTYVNLKGERSVTTRFTIHYDSKGTAHIIPANPKP